MNLLLIIKKISYNKVGLSYEPKTSFKFFSNICHIKKKINHSVYKYNHYFKFDHLKPYYFRKIKYLKWSNIFKSTNTKGPKNNWIPKVKKSNYEADKFDNSNTKCNSGHLNHMIEDINILSYFNPMSVDASYYSNKKGKVTG